jgi:hypothetical protein
MEYPIMNKGDVRMNNGGFVQGVLNIIDGRFEQR